VRTVADIFGFIVSSFRIPKGLEAKRLKRTLQEIEAHTSLVRDLSCQIIILHEEFLCV
jgi:hypothetical protein